MDGLSDRLDRLSPAKRALLEQLLAQRGEARTPAPKSAEVVSDEAVIRRRPSDAPTVLSFAQERMWFLEQWDPGNPFYHLAEGLRMRGPLQPTLLKAAFEVISARHEVLRTRIEATADGPRPVVEEVAPIDWQERDFSATSEPETAPDPEAAARAWIHQRSALPFDLTIGSLWRLSLARLAADHHLLSVTLHHFVADGWSLGILLRELNELYAAAVTGTPKQPATPQIRYTDFAAWQRAWLASDQAKNQLDGWRERLHGVEPLFELPMARPRPHTLGHDGAVVPIPIDEGAGAAIRGLAQRCGATPFMVLISAWALVLSRWSRCQDLVIGTPVANRNRPEVEDLVGCFVNMLPLRFDLSQRESFEQWVTRTRRLALDAFAAQDVPFEQLVDALHLPRNPSHAPLFQVIFALQNAPVGASSLPGLAVQPLRFDLGHAGFDLSLIFEPEGSAFQGELRYNKAIYAAADMDRLAVSFRTLLETAIAAPERQVGDLPLMGQAARDAELTRHQPTSSTTDDRLFVHRRFAAHARRRPDAPALVFDGRATSYGALDRRADRLARRLIQHGVQPGMLVGLCLHRHAELVVSILAILKAGGAYVPLDPINPPARLQLIINDAKVGALVTEITLAHLFPDLDVPRVLVDAEAPHASNVDAASDVEAASEVQVSAEFPAYVIYTSGSTGRPKGVRVTHGNVARLLTVSEQDFDFGPDDVWTLCHSYAFDFSVWELWGALAFGGSLVIVPYEVSRSGEHFHDLLARHGVTVLNQTPSAFRQLMEVEASRQHSLALRWVIFGGEALDPSMLRPWLRRHGDRRPTLVNMYGITETTVHVTFRRLESQDAEARHSRIGLPLADLACYVLDDRLEPVPTGAMGEIHVAGTGLADGYLGRPRLTAQRFVPNPFCTEGERLYRTGDLARWVDGELEYQGRSDHQVKLRGYRIELGDIDAALQSLPAVSAAVTQLHGATPALQRLVAWVIPNVEGASADQASVDGASADGASADAPALQAALRQKLPDYMVPSAFVTLEQLPLTANGKLDTKALPAPEAERSTAPSRPLTDQEARLAQLWRDLLKVESVAPDDDFFALGGHSLNATRLASRVRREFGVELSVRAIFETPRLAAMAALIAERDERAEAHDSPPLPTIQRRDAAQPMVLSFGQERLWFLDQLASDATRTAYLVPAALHILGPVDAERLRLAFSQIVRRHQPLRTAIVNVDGRPVPRLLPAEDVALPLVDLSSLDRDEQEGVRARTFERLLAKPFDLTTGPLLRLQLLRLADDEHALHVALHHIAADGWSVAILMRELSHFYSPEPERARILPEIELTYADYAAHQRAWLDGDAKQQQLDFWRQLLAGAPPTLDLAADRPRPTRRSLEAGRATFEVAPRRAQNLKALGVRTGTTPFMTLLSAFSILLGRYAGQQDLTVGTPVAGRHHAEIEGLVGFFVNTLVLRFALAGNPRFETYLGAVRRRILDAFAHQDLPFEVIVDDLKPPRTLAYAPLFQVMFAYQEQPDALLDLSGLTWSTLQAPLPQTKFDLSLAITETTDGGWRGELIFARDLWDTPSIERFLGHYTALLSAAADAPQSRIDALPWLTAEENQQLLGLAPNDRPYDLETPLIRRLEGIADQNGDAPAVVAVDGTLSFDQLHGQADALAWELIAAAIGPGAVVGLHLEPSSDLLVALLAVMKAGAAYLPLDPSYGAERLTHMVEDADVSVVLTHGEASWDLDREDVQHIAVDQRRRAFASTMSDNAIPGDRPQVALSPQQPAYVLFTSGSTGRPKGVVIEQRGLANYLAWIEETFLRSEVGIRHMPWVTTLAFDTSLKQVFGPWLLGRPVQVVPHREVVHPQRLATALEAPDSALSCVPALWELLLEHIESGEVAAPRGLKALLLGGEALRPSLVARSVRAITGLRIWNFYGPTETTATSINGEVKAGEQITLGRPVANNRIYVLDSQQQPTPMLVPGEIYIGGVGVATGYLKRPVLTAERFQPEPFCAGRMYRTGDAARFLPDGRIEFLGRVDRQVKLRGIRIELGEVESALTAQAPVRQARVSLDADERLVAHLLPRLTPESLETVRRALGRRLPEAMIPARWATLDDWPRLPNGKIDTAALPPPDADVAADAGLPETEMEKKIAAIWSELLAVESIGVQTSFFDLGGHSLLVVRLHSRLRRELPQLDLQMIDIFRFSTVYAQAAWISDQLSTPPHPALARPSTPAPSAAERARGRRDKALARGRLRKSRRQKKP